MGEPGDRRDAETITRLAARSGGRLDLWTSLVDTLKVRRMAEIGVLRGSFAQHVLRACPELSTYYMVDPWRHLDDWNKPSNRDDATFTEIYREAVANTDFAADKRRILRGTTAEVIDQIDDASLDLAYIDGDHTLRGITIDLIRTFPKVRAGGWVGGDDFSADIWQHNAAYEPTLVFPFAVYFAEAVASPIYGLPHDQFVIHKTGDGFRFVDLTGGNREVGLRDQFLGGEAAPRSGKAIQRADGIVRRVWARVARRRQASSRAAR